MKTTVLLAMVDLSGEPPSELRLFKRGLNTTEKGDLVFSERSAVEVIRAFNALKRELSFDYGHGQLSDDNAPENGKSAGWFGLEVREDGLYAVNIRWTPKAYQEIKNREWRYPSPWLSLDRETLEILAIHNCALTNIPATHDAQPLMAASLLALGDTTMREKICTLLGLPMTASDEAIMSALEGKMKMLAEYMEKAGSGGEAMATDVRFTELSAQLSARDVALASLTKEVEQLKAEKLSAERSSLIEQGIREFKIAPAQRAYFEKKSPEDIREFLSTAPTLVQGSAEQRTDSPLPALTEEELAVAKSLNLSAEQMAKGKSALLQSGRIN